MKILLAVSIWLLMSFQQLKEVDAVCVSVQKKAAKEWLIVWKEKKTKRIVNQKWTAENRWQKPPYKKGTTYKIFVKR